MIGLCDYLKSVTRAEHKLAEKALFARCFVRGAVEIDAYVQLLTDLRVVYRHMESIVATTSDPLTRRVWMPRLARSAAIAKDLEVHGTWAKPSDASAIYVDHLGRLAEQQPHLIVAHIYTRYLGDLYGGRILAKMVRRGLKLTTTDGTEFYEFGDDVMTLRTGFRASINELAISEQHKFQIGDEAIRAFALNRGIFEQLQPVSTTRMLKFAVATMMTNAPALQPSRRRTLPETIAPQTSR
jgi:heme oxygenase (biliverdin-producing, ferredoxin)